ncbi:hypothetical protein CBR_g16932 [Chara braunii]|uniref:HAT C-terminal dimerisation domain-containing protein n=1 Tax=Chara braunii TaxID=69332 RepID=A0A388KU46_CHABU|nr:hypothetical protein CBR_g16932 [Chara braunii]|eukprot:GBG73590.1 hypothetical protein CBR_g16932 [Chara braunii]
MVDPKNVGKWKAMRWSSAKLQVKADLVYFTLRRDAWWTELRKVVEMMEPLYLLLRRMDKDGTAPSNLVEYNRLMERMLAEVVHALAFLLDPRRRDLKWLLDRDNALVQNALRYLQRQIGGHWKSKTQVGILSDLREFHKKPTAYDPKRKDRKMWEEDAVTDGGCISPSEWWVTHGGDVPKLQAIAIKVMGMWSTATPAERNWSLMDLVHSKRRNPLKPATVEKLVYIHWNMNLLRASKNVKDHHYVDLWAEFFESLPNAEEGDDPLLEEPEEGKGKTEEKQARERTFIKLSKGRIPKNLEEDEEKHTNDNDAWLLEKYQLSDRLLDLRDLRAVDHKKFGTTKQFLSDFERVARLIPNLSDKDRCLIFLDNFNDIEQSKLVEGMQGRYHWTKVRQNALVAKFDDILYRLLRQQKEEREKVKLGEVKNGEIYKTLTCMREMMEGIKEERLKFQVMLAKEKKSKTKGKESVEEESDSESEEGNESPRPRTKDLAEVLLGIRRFVWEHINDVVKILKRLKEFNLTASGIKSRHCMKRAVILGFLCDEKGRRPDAKKSNKILEWTTPFKSITEIAEEMMKLALTDDIDLVLDPLTIEQGHRQSDDAFQTMGRMSFIMNLLVHEDRLRLMNTEEGSSEVKETFKEKEYEREYKKIGMWLNGELDESEVDPVVREKSKEFIVHDGHLFKKVADGVPKRVVCGTSRQLDVIVALHDGVAGGHRSTRVTLNKIQRLYF